ncbi:MAG: hypothetical protein F6J93_08100 [Oscillatoria sp. SIO1A7]|nr:hypothetical protein [Oscillatoria sp. SIO1A7]
MPNAQFYPEPVVGVARPPGRRGPMPNTMFPCLHVPRSPSPLVFQCPMPNAPCPMQIE